MRSLSRAAVVLFSSMLAACASAPPAAPPAPAAPSEIDRLEKDGLTACEEGTAKISIVMSSTEGKTLSGPEEDRLKADLQEGLKRIVDGMSLLDQANQRTGRTYLTTRYTQAAKAARMKLLELK